MVLSGIFDSGPTGGSRFNGVLDIAGGYPGTANLTTTGTTIFTQDNSGTSGTERAFELIIWDRDLGTDIEDVEKGMMRYYDVEKANQNLLPNSNHPDRGYQSGNGRVLARTVCRHTRSTPAQEGYDGTLRGLEV